MVLVHCYDDEACEINLKATPSGASSLDLDCHLSQPQRHVPLLVESSSSLHLLPPTKNEYADDDDGQQQDDVRDQSLRSLRRSVGTHGNFRSQPSLEFAFSSSEHPQEDLSAANASNQKFLSDLGDPKDCRKLMLVRHGSKVPPSQQNHCYYVYNPFPAATLVYILQRARNLASLELCRIRLSGNGDDFANLSRSIESLSFLQVFSMEQCRLNKANAKRNELEPVVRALASCTCICDITLIADKPGSMGTLSTSTVGFLGRSPSLQILRLEKIGLVDTHIAELSRALLNNRILQTLRLSCTVENPGSSAIVQMLRSNTTIQTFDLFLEQVRNEDSTARLAGALQSSAFLKHYGLGFGTCTSHDGTEEANEDLSSRLKQIQNEVIEAKELAKELEFSSTKLSNCPFIRLVNGIMDGFCLPVSVTNPTTTASHNNNNNHQ